VVIIDGGFLMDSEGEIACTGEREPPLKTLEGTPNCVACWAVVSS
jgi:hypothetical protein